MRGDGVATLEAEDVPSSTAVELRVTVPRTRDRTSAAPAAGQGDGLRKILAEEQELDDDYNSFANRRSAGSPTMAGPGADPRGARGAAASRLRRSRASARASAPEYLPAPPDDASPALAYGLAHEGGDSAPTRCSRRCSTWSTAATTRPLERRPRTRSSTSRSARSRTGRTTSSTSYEQEVLEFFDELLGGETVAMSEMKDEIPEHSASGARAGSG